MEFLLNIFVPAIVSVIASIIAIRLLPLDMDVRKSTVISNLYNSVEKLVKDLEDARNKISQQEEKIIILENRKEVTLKAELHIRLTDPPIIDKSTVQYLVNGPLLVEDERRKRSTPVKEERRK